MAVEKRVIRQTLKMGIKTLIFQEVRLLRLERAFTPHAVLEEMLQSIRETKQGIIKMAEAMVPNQRGLLLQRMLRRVMDEEIDRAIQLRTNRCLRCVHGRFYDEAGTAHLRLPIGEKQARSIGCDRLRPELQSECRRFAEAPAAASLEDYLNELTLLYEFRDMIEQMNKIWEDYLVK